MLEQAGDRGESRRRDRVAQACALAGGARSRWRPCGWPRRARSGAPVGRRCRRGSGLRCWQARSPPAPFPGDRVWRNGGSPARTPRRRCERPRERHRRARRKLRPQVRRQLRPSRRNRRWPLPRRRPSLSRRSPRSQSSRSRRHRCRRPDRPFHLRRAVAPEKATDSGVPAEGCDTSSRRGLWRRSPEACARAFAADPKNASLALAVAQAEHAHARLDEAAEWAKRALALDPNAAEAYIIIARADTENGRDDDARAAYQHYLEVAPARLAQGRSAGRAATGVRQLTLTARATTGGRLTPSVATSPRSPGTSRCPGESR